MGYRSIVISSAVRLSVKNQQLIIEGEAIRVLVGKLKAEEERPADEQLSFF